MKTSPRNSVRTIALLALAALLAMACSREPAWTADEIDSSRHFVQSLQASKEAEHLIRKGNPDVPQLGIDAINERQRTALNEAKLVQDSVLEKAHPELKEHFRSEYQKGLEAILGSYQLASASIAGSPARGQIDLQASGVILLKRWTDWYRAHYGEIEMPAGPSAESR